MSYPGPRAFLSPRKEKRREGREKENRLVAGDANLTIMLR